MADEVPSDSVAELPDPNVLIDRRFLHFAIFGVSDELIDPLVAILRKYLGSHPMTEEEHAIAVIFAEEALNVGEED